MNLIGRFSLRVPRVSRRKPRESSRGSKPCPAHAPPHLPEREDVPMKGKICQWKGRCAHEGEDVPMKGKMRGRCAREGEDVAMKMWQFSFPEGWKQERSRKQTPLLSARRHPSTKNDPRVSLRTGCPPAYRAVTTKKTHAKSPTSEIREQDLLSSRKLLVSVYIWSHLVECYCWSWIFVESKVVSTHLWNTPLNLYQQAVRGFLS